MKDQSTYPTLNVRLSVIFIYNDTNFKSASVDHFSSQIQTSAHLDRLNLITPWVNTEP